MSLWSNNVLESKAQNTGHCNGKGEEKYKIKMQIEISVSYPVTDINTYIFYNDYLNFFLLFL